MLVKIRICGQILLDLVLIATSLYTAHSLVQGWKELVSHVSEGFEGGHVTVVINLPAGSNMPPGLDLNTILKNLPGGIPAASISGSSRPPVAPVTITHK